MAGFLHYLTLPYLLRGALLAIEISFFSLVAAMPLALVLALMRQSSTWLVRWPCLFYIWVIRGTPLLLQLVFWYDILPEIGLRLDAQTTAVIAFALNEAAFSAEIIRGGMLSVKRTQTDAAAALGMSRTLVLRRIIVPQALRVIAPALSNEAIVLIKNTSLASVIAVTELTQASNQLTSVNFEYVSVFAASGALYLAITSVIMVLQIYLERSLNVERRAAAKATGITGRRLLTTALDGRSDSRDGPSAAEELMATVRERRRQRLAETQATTTTNGVSTAEAQAWEIATAGAEVAPSIHGPFVDIRDVHKSFHGKEVLRGVSLTVAHREVLLVLGPSGSGKTTLLRTINHLEPISGGEILVAGQLVGYKRVDGRVEPVKNLARARAHARIGMVFQHFNLFDHMSVLENVMEAPVRVSGRQAAEVRYEARALLARTGLAGYEDLYPHQLSGGQQQRVAIVRALATRPQLMLFDEPTSALDPELVGEVLHVMRELAEDGMTMIIVSHEIDFARRCATRVAFMDEGRVVEAGPPEAVLDNPQEERTRRFLRLVERDAVPH